MIVGAGFAGLIAGCLLPGHELHEAATEPAETHKALLRFRGRAVEQATRIPFRGVTVHKGIYLNGRFRAPDVAMANLYADKVLGRVEPRSIWDLRPVERWIAPENFHEQLLDRVGGRIRWGSPVEFGALDEAVISTAPLPITLRAVGITCSEEFLRAPIRVERYRVPDCDVHQTVYFPGLGETDVYRASITGDLLILEHAHHSRKTFEDADLVIVARAFGLLHKVQEFEALGAVEQKFGKISPIPGDTRRALLAQLTREHGIYSLGRFATWRNVLLDDVVQDVTQIQKLMSGDEYARRLKAT